MLPESMLKDLKNILNKHTIPVLLLFLTLSIIITTIHIYNIDIPAHQSQIVLHNQILSKTAQKPYNERILQPLLVESAIKLIHVLGINVSYNLIFLVTYALIKVISIFLSFLFLEKIFSFFGSKLFALIGVLYFAAIYPLTFNFYYYQPTSILELALYIISIYLILRNTHFMLLCGILFLAVLNRNTAVFVVLYYFLWNAESLYHACAYRDFRKLYVIIGKSAALFFIWLLTLKYIACMYPGSDWVFYPLHYLKYNFLEKTALRVWFFSLILAWPVIISVIIEWKTIQPRYRILALWGAPYCAVYLLMAQCDEVRYWLPLYVVYAPFLAATFSKFVAHTYFSGDSPELP